MRLLVNSLVCLAVSALGASAAADDLWVEYPGGEGPGAGKHIVFVTGDDEYRSEESMPELAKLLSVKHGFRCTVLFAIDPETGAISPTYQENIPGTEQLADADLMVLFTRFRDLPPEQMQPILDYTDSGKPIIALRTATHPFMFRKYADEFGRFSYNSGEPNWQGGYGRQVLGETWVNHHGHHQVESARGLPSKGQEGHPILRGINDIWGPGDVYGIRSLTGDSTPIVDGVVLTGMNPGDPPNKWKSTMPMAWTKTHETSTGAKARVFTTTMGHAGDFDNAGVRRMLVNACYWGLEMENVIDPESDVEFLGEYDPTPIGFGGAKEGVRPADHAL